MGERTIRRVWLDDAPSIAGGWPAGTATEERVRGNHLAGNLEVLVPQHEVEREAHQ